nr:MAG TPA: hypothetical protein [Caudoviricetes sp.]
MPRPISYHQILIIAYIYRASIIAVIIRAAIKVFIGVKLY